jgi:Tfp pilus assembly protein PilX
MSAALSTSRWQPRCPRQRGTVLVVALLIMALIALGLGSYLMLNLSTSRLARQSYQQNAAFNLAEAGAEEAVWSFNRANAQANDAWTGWTNQDGAMWQKFSNFDFGGNTSGTVKVYVNNSSPAASEKPQVVALSSVEAPNTPPNTRMIEVTLGRRSYFSNGLVAKETLSFAGENTTVDSWNSDPDNNPVTPAIPYDPMVRTDRGSIATMAVENSAMLINKAAIWGYVATGGAAPEVGVGGSIRGLSTPADVQIDPARISTDFAANLPTITAPTDGTPIASVGATLGTLGQATKWRCPAIILSGKQTLTILGDVTVVLTAGSGAALDVTGNASIIVPVGSSLTVYVEGDLKIAGNGLGNANAAPVSCLIWGTSTSLAGQSIDVVGNGALKATIYAPNATVSINGNGEVMGAIVGRAIKLTGNVSFHYDESLASYGGNTPFRVTRWRELTSASDRAYWLGIFSGK